MLPVLARPRLSPASGISWLLTLLVFSALPGQAALAQRGMGHPAIREVAEPICRMVEDSARRHRLPVPFLTRLVWAESAFQVDAVSRAGALGVAQFMPETASRRGLADPLNPQLALAKAGEYLAALTGRFGNLGLAAAAYNAGPARLGRWLDGRGDLAAETRNYVQTITGRPVDDWAAARRQRLTLQPVPAVVAEQSCLQQIESLSRQRRPLDVRNRVPSSVPPFEVRLAAYFDKVLAQRPVVSGAVAESAVVAQPPVRTVPNRPEALALCASVEALGMHCVVNR